MHPIRVLVFGLVSVVVVAATVVGLASPAAACSCAGAPFEINEEFGSNGVAGYDAVFVGSLVDSENEGQDTFWQFDIDFVVRGELATPIVVVTPSDGGACGFENLFPGDVRAVGLTDRAGQWQSGLCSIDMPEAVADIDVRAEPSIAPVVEESDGLTTGGGLGLGMVAVGFVAVAAVALLATRAGRRA